MRIITFQTHCKPYLFKFWQGDQWSSRGHPWNKQTFKIIIVSFFENLLWTMKTQHSVWPCSQRLFSGNEARISKNYIHGKHCPRWNKHDQLTMAPFYLIFYFVLWLYFQSSVKFISLTFSLVYKGLKGYLNIKIPRIPLPNSRQAGGLISHSDEKHLLDLWNVNVFEISQINL